MLSALVMAISLAFGPRIIDVSLQLDDDAMQSLQRAPNTDVRALMTVGAEGAERRYAVTIHVKGQLGSARAVDDKPAFKIKLEKGERFLGLEHLTLNNMVQDPTMLHEALGYEVYASVGVAVPKTGYVRLTVDGQDYGLYLNVETIDRTFLERVFHERDGILYEGAYGADLREGDETSLELHEGNDPGRSRLTSLIRAVHTPGDGVFYGDTAQVDTPSFLAMMAAAALLDDWDNYYAANNYRLYWSPSASRWFFIPTGIDQTFGGDATTIFGAIGVLFQKCLGSDRCANEYAAAVRDAATRFEHLGLSTSMDALLSVIDAASQSDPRKPYDDAAMRAARESMRAFIGTQPARVRDEIACLEEAGAASLEACAGMVAMNAGYDGCLELTTRNPAQHGPAARVSRCLGGTKQRWRLIPAGGAFQIVAVASGYCLDASKEDPDETRVRQTSCDGGEGRLFTLRPGSPDTALVAKSTGRCLAIAPGTSKTPAVVQLPCAPDPGQRWRVQRSLFN